MKIKIDKVNYCDKGLVFIFQDRGKDLDVYTGKFYRLDSKITKDLIKTESESDLNKSIRVMELISKYRYLETNRIAGLTVSKEDYVKRLLIWNGIDPMDYTQIDFNDFIITTD